MSPSYHATPNNRRFAFAILVAIIVALFGNLGTAFALPASGISGLPAPGSTRPLLGTPASFSFNFTNTAAPGVGNVGYGPFIEVAVDTSGPDGAAALPTDGYGTPTVTAAGLPMTPAGTPIVLTIGQTTFVNPLTGETRPVPAGFGVRDTIYVYALPFGSFTPGQTTAVTLAATTSNLADVGTALPIAVTGGFRDDEPALNGPGRYGATVTTDITPQLYVVTKTYLGPENETATGPNYVRRYRVEADIATGQPVSNLRLTDDLAPSMQIVGRNSTHMAAFLAPNLATNVFAAGNLSGTAVETAPDGTLTYAFGSVTGVAGVDAAFEFDFYVPRDDSSAAQVLPQLPLANPTTGTDSVTATNTSDGRLNWTPLDGRDTAQTDVAPAASGSILTHTLEEQSLAIQKTAQTIDPTTGNPVAAGQIVPGSSLIRYTLNFQVSDYYAVQSIVVNDLLGDGLRLFTGTRGAVTAGIPTLQVNNAYLTGAPNGSRVNMAAGAFGGGTIDYQRRYTLQAALPAGTASDPTSFPGTGPIDPAFSAPTVGATLNGTTLLSFDVSAELQRRLGPNAGRLVGGEINNDGSGPDNDPFAGPRLGAATGTIVFYAEVSQDFSDDFPSSDRSVDQGDMLDNTVNDPAVAGRDGIVAEQIRPAEINAATPTVIGTATDDSGASTQLSYGVQSKTINRINGDPVPVQTALNPPFSVQAGDRITYKLTYTLPINSYEQLRLVDYPPLPVMPVGATSLYTFEGASPTYAAYTVAIAPDDNFFAPVGFVGPTVQVATTAALAGAVYNPAGGTAGNGAFSSAPATIDGVNLVNGNLVLVKDQADARQNGVYRVVSAGNWERDASMDVELEVESSRLVRASGGSTNAGDDFVQTNNAFSQFNAASGRGDIVFAPFISADPATNAITFNFGNFDDPLRRSGTVSLLLTLPVGNQGFASDLFLTNQLRVSEASTNAGTTTVEDLRRYELVRPQLTIQKGVIGANTTGFTLGGITFTNPSVAANFSGGPVDTAAEANAIGARNLGVADTVDAGDRVRFAIVPQNTGKGDAFDVVLADQVQPGFTIPASVAGLNLVLRRGDGTLLATTADVNGFVRAATTADIGGTFTSAVANGQFTGISPTFDGATLQVGDRVLIKDQTNAAQNGIYTVTARDSVTELLTLQRATDANTAPALSNYRVAVMGGTAHGDNHFQFGTVATLNIDPATVGAALGVRDYFTTYNAVTGAFQILLSDNYTAGNVGGATEDNRTGSLSRGKRTDQALGDQAITNGSNTVVAMYDLVLANTASPNQTITNTAAVRNYATVGGGVDLTDPANVTGASDPTDTATVVVRLPLQSKALVGTEITAPGNNAASQATIGELVAFRLTITVPEGVTPGASIVDNLVAGLAFVDVTSVTPSAALSFATPIGTGAAPANTAITNNGRTITFNPGTISNSDNDNATAETIVIIYRAVVLNTNGAVNNTTNINNNQAGQTRNNSALFGWTNNATTLPTVASGQSTGTTGTRTGTATPVTIVEPTLSNTKDVRNVTDGGAFGQATRGDNLDVIQYRVTIANANAASDTTANDLALSDTIPAAVTSPSILSVTSSGTIRFNGTARAALPGDFDLTGNLLTIAAGINIDMDPGSNIVITVQGTFTGATGLTTVNTADLRWTSLDGTPGARSTYSTNSTERDGADGVLNGGARNDYRVLDTADITFPPVVRKTIIDTSEPGTTPTVAHPVIGGLADRVAIGEVVRQRLYASVAEGQTRNFQVQDFVPAGMRFLNNGTARFAFLSTGASQLNSTGITNITGLGTGGAGNLNGSTAELLALAPASIAGTFNDDNVAPAATGAGTGDATLYASGSSVFFRFGDLNNTDNDVDAEYVVIEYNALVENIAGNQAGATRVNNFAVLVDSDGNGTTGYVSVVQDTDASGTATAGDVTSNATDTDNDVSTGPNTPGLSNNTTATIVEPNLAINKEVIATTGAVATYRITLTNTGANASQADNVRIVDALPIADLTLIAPGSLTASLAGGAAGATNNSSGNTVDFTITTVPVGGSVQIVYTANVLTNPTGATTINNTATATATSLTGANGTMPFFGTVQATLGTPGTATGERTGADGPGGALNDYAVADTERLGSLGDRVYFDADGDGVQDAGEPGLVGVPVTVTWAGPDGNLATAGDNSVINTTTGGNGVWTVTGLPVGGNFQVSVPAAVSGMSVTDAVDNGSLNATNSSNVTLTLATPNPRNQDFGYRGTASLGNRIYIDADGDGVQDVNGLEPSLPGVVTTLTWAGFDGSFGNADDLTFTQNASNAAANYLYTNLPAGEFRVAVSPSGGSGGVPDNTTLTDALDNGLLGTDPDGLGAGTIQTNLSAGENELTIDFGYRGTASIGDYVWYDVDGDGVQDANEPPIAGATVTLLWSGPDGNLGTAADNVTFTTTTDSSGLYLFPSLPVNGASDPYRVTMTPVAAYPNQTYDADGLLSANTSTLNLGPAENNTAQDFGYRGSATLGNLVWEDLNGNGRQDGGEPGINGVTVDLLYDANTNGTFEPGELATPLLTATTSGGGAYSFPNLAAGNYRVRFGTSDGVTTYTRTTRDAAVAVDATDSDGDPASGETATYTLALGDNNQTVDQGLYRPVTLGDRVWYDVDADGVQEAGEPGISGATVTVVWLGPDAAPGGGDDVTYPATTGANGAWSVAGLPPGSFAVTASALPDGLTALTDSIDNGVLSAANPVAVSTNSGVNRSDIDFGYRGTASLGDRVWLDLNRDGTQNANEPGIPGLPVTLTWLGQDGVAGGGDDVTFTMTTGADGAYLFQNLPAGNLQVAVDTSGTNLAPTYDLDDGTASPNGNSAATLASGQNRTDVDFGFIGAASIGDRVWLDQDADGVQDTGENGIPGASVQVTWAGPDDDLAGTADNLVFAATTGANGAYLFTGLPVFGAADDYRVEVTALPFPGLTLTDSLDNGGAPDPVNPVTLSVAGSGPNQNRRDVDFGYDGLSTLAGTVYRDDNNNGVQDPGEPGIQGVTLTLTGVDVFGNPVIDPATGQPYTVTTDTDGDYVFNTVVPGTYIITEAQPGNYNDGLDTAGSLGGNAGNDVISGIPVGPSENGTDYNFGERGTFLSGVVFRDDNRDGALDPGETGRLTGVTVQLFDGAGTNLLGTATTGPDGSYRFDNLAPGAYRVVETQPAGYASSPAGPFAPNTRDVTLPLAGLADQNFGEVLASISGMVYVDANSSGTRQAGETGIANVPVTLTGTDSTGTPVNRTLVTDAQGRYSFTGLFPPQNGTTYTIDEGSAAPYTDRASNVGTGLATPGASATANQISGIGLTAGQQGLDYDFGELQPPATFISGSVYVDTDRSGTRQPAEPGISAVTITLRDAGADGIFGNGDDGAPVTATTDANGNYTFPGLAPGRNYQVIETQPNIYGNSPLGPATIISVDNLPVAGSTGNNFGEILGSLAGTVYFDRNNDGALSVGEPGIGGVTVTLAGTDLNGASVNRTATTDVNGTYRFGDLPAGNYAVTETQPAAYADGQETLGSAGGIVGADTMTAIPLGAGVDATGYNFGELGVPVSGTVFRDRNRDGDRQIGSEPGIPGVTIRLVDGSGAVVGTATTDASGNYTFPNVPPGDYTVVEVQPAGYGDPPGGPFAPNDRPVTVTNVAVTGQNFGDTLSTLAGAVYFDVNGDGARQVGEPGIGAVPVQLFGPGPDDTFGTADDVLVQVTTTGSNGNYQFTDLPNGRYQVVETQPGGYTDGQETVGTAGGMLSPPDTISEIVLPAGVDRDGYLFGETILTPPGTAALGGTVYLDTNNNGVQDPGEPGLPGVTITVADGVNPPVVVTTGAGGTYMVSGLTPGNTYTITESQPGAFANGLENGSNSITINPLQPGGSFGNNFGELPGTISGLVYYDRDASASQGPGDLPIPGATVRLLDGAGNPVTDLVSGQPYQLATLADGSYRFTNLPAGDYRVVETQPAGYNDGAETAGTGAAVGANDRIDVALPAGGDSPGNNFGELGTTISGVVWLDRDRDGSIGAAETIRIGGVTIQLFDSNGNLAGTTTSDPVDGSYRFTNLLPGTYTIVQTQPGLYGSSTPNTIAVTLPLAGLTNQNFGETLGSLAGSVYVDLNGNGLRDPGEPGIPGVTVTLSGTDVNGTAVTPPPATTDANGDYLFSDLPAGTYQVAEPNQPNGYLDGREQLGSAGGTIDAATFNDEIRTIPLSAGTDLASYNFGEAGASLRGSVYLDRNNNGSREASEPGINGVTVTLIGTDVDGNTVNRTAATDSDGDYSFDALPAGNYTITETQPPAWGDGQETLGDTGGTVGNDTFTAVGLDPAEQASGYLFGEVGGSISGSAFIGSDPNGVRGPNDPPLTGITIILIEAGPDGIFGTPDDVRQTTQTGNDGAYSFGDLPGGNYRVEVDRGTLPPNLAEVFDRDGGADSRSGVSLGAGQNVTQEDFSYATPTAITLASFTVTRDGGRVVVRWQTALEQDTFGFQVYRSATGSRADAELITPAPIPAQGRGQGGANYEVEDTTARPGVSYAYWLVEIETGGRTSEYGPVRYTIPPAGLPYVVSLPLVVR